MINLNRDINSFNNIINNNKSFMVVSHISPDGDAIGSLLSMTLALKKIGKKVYPVINDVLPEKYSFLPEFEKISKIPPKKCDVAICLDCGDEKRLGLTNDIREIADIVVNIDHHKSNTLFANFNYVYPDASSVGEIMYFFVTGFTKIDSDIAKCIYTAIITDTGSIGYSNTNPVCLKILARLIQIGVKPDYIRRRVFDIKSLEYIKLLGLVLNTLEIFDDGRIACLYVTEQMMKKTNAKDEDTAGLINYARDIEDVEVAILFKEKENKTKVGFRSNKWVDVSKIAEKFGGGGHAKASGCTLNFNLSRSQKIVVDAVRHYLMEVES